MYVDCNRFAILANLSQLIAGILQRKLCVIANLILFNGKMTAD